MRTPYLLAALLIVAVAAALGVWVNSDAVRGSGHHTLRALYAIEPPFAFIDRNGRVTGEAPEVLRVVARKAGYSDVEFVHAEFVHLLHDLQAGRADVVAAGMFVTPERARRVRFTRPTARVGSALLVARGNPLDLHSYESLLLRPDAVLAVVDGSVEPVAAQRAGVPVSRIQRHGDATGAVVAVIEGRADALALSDVSLRHFLATAGFTGVELAEPFTPPERDGKPDAGWPAFALRQQDEALARRLDNALGEFIGSAEHRALVEAFGFGADNLPTAGRP